MILPNYNIWKEKEIELFPGEELCSWCEGSGIRKIPGLQYNVLLPCRKCKGEGKIDWITKIIHHR